MKTETQSPNPVGSSAGLAADRLQWRVHTYGLLKEITDCSGMSIYHMPINILGKLLAAVGERAIELDDPKLNALMCRLTIYTAADPESPDYDPETVRAVMQAANRKFTRNES